MPSAISSSSQLIQLAMTGGLGLLRDQFEEIDVPRAAWEEATYDRNEPDARRIASCKFMKVFDLDRSSPLLSTLGTMLDRGEAEAIAMALGMKHDVVLLDDSEARAVAVKHGLKVTGTLGIFLRAKRMGRIDKIEPLLEILASRGFSLDPSLRKSVLMAAGE